MDAISIMRSASSIGAANGQEKNIKNYLMKMVWQKD